MFNRELHEQQLYSRGFMMSRLLRRGRTIRFDSIRDSIYNVQGCDVPRFTASLIFWIRIEDDADKVQHLRKGVIEFFRKMNIEHVPSSPLDAVACALFILRYAPDCDIGQAALFETLIRKGTSVSIANLDLQERLADLNGHESNPEMQRALDLYVVNFIETKNRTLRLSKWSSKSKKLDEDHSDKRIA